MNPKLALSVLALIALVGTSSAGPFSRHKNDHPVQCVNVNCGGNVAHGGSGSASALHGSGYPDYGHGAYLVDDHHKHGHGLGGKLGEMAALGAGASLVGHHKGKAGVLAGLAALASKKKHKHHRKQELAGLAGVGLAAHELGHLGHHGHHGLAGLAGAGLAAHELGHLGHHGHHGHHGLVGLAGAGLAAHELAHLGHGHGHGHGDATANAVSGGHGAATANAVSNGAGHHHGLMHHHSHHPVRDALIGAYAAKNYAKHHH